MLRRSAFAIQLDFQQFSDAALDCRSTGCSSNNRQRCTAPPPWLRPATGSAHYENRKDLTMLPTPLRVLFVEDEPNDAKLVAHELERCGFAPSGERVETREEFLAHLDPSLDLILADFTTCPTSTWSRSCSGSMKASQGRSALHLCFGARSVERDRGRRHPGRGGGLFGQGSACSPGPCRQTSFGPLAVQGRKAGQRKDGDSRALAAIVRNFQRCHHRQDIGRHHHRQESRRRSDLQGIQRRRFSASMLRCFFLKVDATRTRLRIIKTCSRE